MSANSTIVEPTTLRQEHGPVRLDLGGGRHPLEGYLNVDLRSAPEVDVVTSADDLGMFPDDSVAAIHCNSLIPHLPNLNRAFGEWSRVLEPGGELVVKATHAHCTGIVQDPDHRHWSWTARTPEWYDKGAEFDYYADTALKLEAVEVVGWLRPERRWLRVASWLFGRLVDRVTPEIADELMKLPFAGGRVIATFRGVKS